MSENNDRIDPPIDSPEKDRPKITLRATSDTAKGRLAKKKWLILIGGAGVVIILVSSVLGGKPTPPRQQAVAEKPLSIVPAADVRASFEQRTQVQISELDCKIREFKDAQTGTQTSIKQLRALVDANQSDSIKALYKLTIPIGKLTDQQSEIQKKASLSNVPQVPNGSLPPPPSGTQNLGAIPPPPPPLPPGAKGIAGEVVPADPDAPIISSPSDGDHGKKGTVNTNTTYTQNKYAGYIPSGSFASVVLITGIEAGTASQSQANPQPVLMRVQTDAVLPGSAGYKIKSCMITGSSFGSASTERAYIRLASLSCVDKEDHLVIDAPLKGYVVDSDGMFGLRGKQVQRAGALLAKTMLAGFAAGLGQALGGAQGTSFSGSGGVGTALSGTAALKSAGFGGASSAANELAKFYLDQAKNIFPVIEVPPKRKATIVLSEGASLKWNDYGSLFIKTETPTK